MGVGIVGLSATQGWAAGAHAPALAALDGIELRALMASSASTGRVAGAVHGVPAASLGWGTPTSERARYTLDRRNGATLLPIAFGHMIDAVSLVVGGPEELVATTATRRPLIPAHRDGEADPDDCGGPDRGFWKAGRRCRLLRSLPRRCGVAGLLAARRRNGGTVRGHGSDPSSHRAGHRPRRPRRRRADPAGTPRSL